MFSSSRRSVSSRQARTLALEPLRERLTPAVTAAFSAAGVLSVFGDAADNAITVSRNAAGGLLVNSGAVTVKGGTPTVANTVQIQVFGQGGNDQITFNEASGALPMGLLYGGAGNDTLTGGSANDLLFGQGGNDILLGKGGFDLLFGGDANDTLTGGDADDQVFGQGGNDRMIWNPGDDTDLNEGGAGIDTVEINGGNGTESYTLTANGTRVRLDRLTPAPFSIDIGTSENFVLNANGGDDSFSATGNLAALIKVTVAGGTGNDTLLGSNGNDGLFGGDGDDFIDGQQGNDTVVLGAGNDTFQWDPGDGSDIVEGQEGSDRMIFNGSAIAEKIDVSANRERLRFTRDVANIVMDLNDVERIDLNLLGGADTLTINDLTGTDLTEFNANLEGALNGGLGDGAADTVIIAGTSGDDVISAVTTDAGVEIFGLPVAVKIEHAEAAVDRLVINGLAGDDVLDASALLATSLLFSADGGEGDDVLIGGQGDDTLLGGIGDDVLLGGPGNDILDGGDGDNILIQ